MDELKRQLEDQIEHVTKPVHFHLYRHRANSRRSRTRSA